MLCPVCAALNREHNSGTQLGNVRPRRTRTLRQRAEWIGGHRADQLAHEVLRSLERQAHIAFELHEHQSKQHPFVITAAG